MMEQARQVELIEMVMPAALVEPATLVKQAKLVELPILVGPDTPNDVGALVELVELVDRV